MKEIAKSLSPGITPGRGEISPPHRPPRVTLRRLQVFAAIAETGGFRAAAERLGMAQPSVSTHVHALETEAGGALFRRRRGSGAELTELGQTLLRHARQLLTEAEDMAIDLGRARAEIDRRVVFSCQRPLSDYVSPFLAGFALAHPDVALLTKVGRQEEVMEHVETGAASLGICLSNSELEGLRSVVVGRRELAIVASADHPLAQRKNINPSELDAFNFVGAPEGSLLGQGIDRMLADIGVRRVTLVSKATEFEILRALVIANVGLYCCMLNRIQPDLDRGTVVRLSIDAPPLEMSIRLLFPWGRPLSPSTELFAAFLRNRLKEPSRSGPAAPARRR